jgi:hypothetical protein
VHARNVHSFLPARPKYVILISVEYIADFPLVYYSDFALKLNLPSRSSFSQKTAPILARELIKYARSMLANEQIRERQGGADEGKLLVKQLIGKFPLTNVKFAHILHIQRTCIEKLRSLTHALILSSACLGGNRA